MLILIFAGALALATETDNLDTATSTETATVQDEQGGGGGPMLFTMAVWPIEGGDAALGNLWGGRGYGYTSPHLRVGGWGAGGGFNGADGGVGMGLGGISAEAVLPIGPIELPAGVLLGFGGYGASWDSNTDDGGFLMAVFPTAGAELNALSWLKIGLNVTGMYTVGPTSPMFGIGTTAHLGFGSFAQGAGG